MTKEKKIPSILVIEDNEMFRRLAIDMLNGYTVFSAENAAEGLSKYKKHNPDITFIDIGLPDDNGINVINNIKLIKPDAFMVMLTASNLKNDVEESLKKGAQGYVVKPFSRQKIKECIDRYNVYEKKV